VQDFKYSNLKVPISSCEVTNFCETKKREAKLGNRYMYYLTIYKREGVRLELGGGESPGKTGPTPPHTRRATMSSQSSQICWILFLQHAQGQGSSKPALLFSWIIHCKRTVSWEIWLAEILQRLWTPAYIPGDGQTSLVYSNNPELHLCVIAKKLYVAIFGENI
jgi:hypothetical protein